MRLVASARESVLPETLWRHRPWPRVSDRRHRARRAMRAGTPYRETVAERLKHAWQILSNKAAVSHEYRVKVALLRCRVSGKIEAHQMRASLLGLAVCTFVAATVS